MIKTFKCKHTKSLFNGQSPKVFKAFEKGALRKLQMLDMACCLDDLRVPPANRLEALKGDRLGQYSIRINKQWRICFEYADGNVFAVEIVDYH